MYIELIKNWQMSRRWESRWLEFRIEDNNYSPHKYLEASCVEFAWTDVSGTPTARIKFIVSNNQRTSKVLKEIEITTESNFDNSTFLAIYFPSFMYFKIIYEPNGVANGRLSIGAVYR